MGKIQYSILPGLFAAANQQFIEKCSELYSSHYGIWGAEGVHPNKNIKLSPNKLRDWLANEDVSIYYASDNDDIIGYAIAFSKDEKGYGVVTWVTQLVVHEDYRNHGIAKNILFSIWGFSNQFAWGIVSANPYAIRALEKATRRRAVPIRIKKNAVKLKNIGRENVPFINDETVFEITENTSKVNTNFFVEHSDNVNKIANITNEEMPWLLGNLQDGWEWFAFTFNDQPQISLSIDEIENMVATADDVVRQAYAKMNLSGDNQKWMKNTASEIEFVLKISDKKITSAYDLGCGIGRHSIELARYGINITAVDYIKENIQRLDKSLEQQSIENITPVLADCRQYTNDKKAELVLCLYDVIGTFADDKDNIKIIKTAFDLLENDGIAVFSVMNYESTLANAKKTFVFADEPDKLLTLAASDIMEKTGDVFDSDYYIVDTETHIVYRKEQFSSGTGLPVEMIVRDRRYTKNEITAMCENVGFEVLDSKYTNASGWNKEYDADSKRAKEILVVCKKK